MGLQTLEAVGSLAKLVNKNFNFKNIKNFIKYKAMNIAFSNFIQMNNLGHFTWNFIIYKYKVIFFLKIIKICKQIIKI